MDECGLLVALIDLVEHFGTPSAVNFFKSTEARKEGSKARKLVESGREWIKERPEEEQARIVFAAILLGGKTLTLFTNALQDPEIKKRGLVEEELKRLLNFELELDEIFASWLSCNLHRLNKESVKFLETLEPDTYYFVRTSTVA